MTITERVHARHLPMYDINYTEEDDDDDDA